MAMKPGRRLTKTPAAAARIRPEDISDAKRTAFRDVPAARAAFDAIESEEGADGPIPDGA